jgi:hypothetical protein
MLCMTLLACGDSHAARPDAPNTPSDGSSKLPASIEIDIDHPALLVAFRDGLDQPWQAASMMSATRYTIDVHGPYLAAVVNDETTDPQNYHMYVTRWIAQTPDDDHTITIATQAPTGSNVTGQMLQAGRVFVGDDYEFSSTANWTFGMLGAPGPHDFFAFSADHALMRRAVDTTNDIDLGTLDVDASGIALQQVAFTATNATANDTLTSRAAITTATTAFASVSGFGPANAVAVVPDSALESGDVQTVSVGATDGGHGRYLRKPYHAGGNAAYTLPTNLLVGPTWMTGTDLGLSWTAIASSLTSFDMSVSPDTTLNLYDLAATAHFFAATGVDHIALDTQVPGYQDAWKVDLTQGYYLDAQVQTVDADVTETELYEDHVMTMSRTDGDASRRNSAHAGRTAGLRAR